MYHEVRGFNVLLIFVLMLFSLFIFVIFPLTAGGELFSTVWEGTSAVSSPNHTCIAVNAGELSNHVLPSTGTGAVINLPFLSDLDSSWGRRASKAVFPKHTTVASSRMQLRTYIEPDKIGESLILGCQWASG